MRRKIVSTKYFNCHPYAVVIVAVEGFYGIDWAAYIGVLDSSREPSDEDLQGVAADGCKLAVTEAAGMFPGLDINMYRQ